MHAAYSFLIDENDKDRALSSFETYAERHCDENNWYEPLVLVTEDGEVFNCATKDDWRGRDNFAENNGLLKMLQKDRFGWAKKFALECVVADMLMGVEFSDFGNKECSLVKRGKEQGYGDIIASIMQDVPPVLAKASRIL
jgi:hypothetical protein